MIKKMEIGVQYLLPHHALSRLLGLLAENELPWLKRHLIKLFASRYKVDMSDALESDLDAYPNFNSFFTRALKPDARPIAADEERGQVIVSPADGVISQFGDINEGKLIQAKGQDFTLRELMGGSQEWYQPFEGGKYMTIYLAPFNYHRVHMPLAGKLDKMIYVPGRLFSVNKATAAAVPNLFARNERVISIFNRPNAGDASNAMAVVLVGAMVVGGIHTVWAGQVSPPHRRSIVLNRYYQNQGNATVLDKGDQMGHFSVGSTAIVLFGPDAVKWNESLSLGQTIRMGEAVGQAD